MGRRAVRKPSRILKTRKGLQKMKHFYSTRQVAGILGIKPDLLQKAIWTNRVIPPIKSPSGNYLWIIDNIESAAWALHRYDQFKAWQEEFVDLPNIVCRKDEGQQ